MRHARNECTFRMGRGVCCLPRLLHEGERDAPPCCPGWQDCSPTGAPDSTQATPVRVVCRVWWSFMPVRVVCRVWWPAARGEVCEPPARFGLRSVVRFAGCARVFFAAVRFVGRCPNRRAFASVRLGATCRRVVQVWGVGCPGVCVSIPGVFCFAVLCHPRPTGPVTGLADGSSNTNRMFVRRAWRSHCCMHARRPRWMITTLVRGRGPWRMLRIVMCLHAVDVGGFDLRCCHRHSITLVFSSTFCRALRVSMRIRRVGMGNRFDSRVETGRTSRTRDPPASLSCRAILARERCTVVLATLASRVRPSGDLDPERTTGIAIDTHRTSTRADAGGRVEKRATGGHTPPGGRLLGV